MRRPPTPEEFTRIMAALEKVQWKREGEFFTWGTQEDMAEAKALTKAVSGHWAQRPCYACYIQCADILREAVNLPPISRPVPPERYEHRMSICRPCPAFHKRTISCGRLGVDALTPKAVLIDGNPILPCGCFLPMKANLKHAQCPAQKW